MHSRFETAVAASLVALVTGFSLHAVRTGIFAGQSIPIDSLYVNGTAGEEMGPDYVVPLQYGSNLRFRWNMSTVSTREGYSIYCGFQKNNGGYQIVEAQRDSIETIAQPTKFDFECRSCMTGSEQSCFQSSNTDYITTYQRTLSAYVAGVAPVLPSSTASSSAASVQTSPVVAEQSFVPQGTRGEKPSGDTLTLRAGSMLRLAWNISTVNTREPIYSIYCGLSKNGGALTQVSGTNDSMEELPGESTYELACRSCRNFTDYTETPRPDPWDVCFNRLDNTDYIETFRKKYTIKRELYCGDSKITGAERCDDGTNTTPGDGCSMSCAIEPGWTCVGAPSKCNICGNASLEGTESCDDGNKIDGDGCSSACQTETGYACVGTTCTYSKACSDGVDNDGDGLIDAQENRASSTNLFGDEANIRAYLNGISALITPDPLQEKEFACQKYGYVNEEEDMKDTAADKFCRLFQYDEAITSSCVPIPWGDWKLTWGQWHGEQMIRVPSMIGNYSYYNAIRCSVNPDCSDGEDNDYDNKKDMNDPDCTNPSDTSELRADNGCTSPTDLTEGNCGDGTKEPAEQCDDGNVKSGDGCSSSCQKEQGTAGTVVSSASSAPFAVAASSAISRTSSSAAQPFVQPVLDNVPAASSVSRMASSAYAAGQAYSVYSQPTAPVFVPSATKLASSAAADIMKPAAPASSAPTTFFPSSGAASSQPSALELLRQFIDTPSSTPSVSSSGSPSSSDAAMGTHVSSAVPDRSASGDVLCPADACIWGRQCLAYAPDVFDCILPPARRSQAVELKTDDNYLLLLKEQGAQMRLRCLVLNAIWAPEGYTCAETFTFPYIQRIPVAQPIGFNPFLWIGRLLSY